MQIIKSYKLTKTQMFYKFHIVEKHVAEFIELTKLGLGHFSEVCNIKVRGC